MDTLTIKGMHRGRKPRKLLDALALHWRDLRCAGWTRALVQILESHSQNVLLVTGQPQSGKTTVARAVVAELDSAVYLPGLFVTGTEDLPANLVSGNDDHTPAVIVIDDAEIMDLEAVESLIDTASRSASKVLLFTHPRFTFRLHQLLRFSTIESAS